VRRGGHYWRPDASLRGSPGGGVDRAVILYVDGLPYVKAFTALAMARPITVREISDCSAIPSLAHGLMGMTSVGLNAVLVVMPRIR
jgi:hypothetical protein